MVTMTQRFVVVWSIAVLSMILLSMAVAAHPISQASGPPSAATLEGLRDELSESPANFEALGFNVINSVALTDTHVESPRQIWRLDQSFFDGDTSGDLGKYFYESEDRWVALIRITDTVHGGLIMRNIAGNWSSVDVIDKSSGQTLVALAPTDKVFYDPVIPGWFALHGDQVIGLNDAGRGIVGDQMSLAEFGAWVYETYGSSEGSGGLAAKAEQDPLMRSRNPASSGAVNSSSATGLLVGLGTLIAFAAGIGIVFGVTRRR
ncbi:MAG: hypothetical protein ABI780_06410 [Ardenticatenales bacterium]